MTHLKIITFLFIAITLLASCTKNQDKEIIQRNFDCVFEQNDDNLDGIIDDAERKTMNDCIQNSLSSKSDIESNLIGEWELTGHGEGWVTKVSKPCGYIVISQDELIFEFQNAYIDTISTHQWEIEEVNWNGVQSFKLKVHSGNLEGMNINQFCENYMFGDATPLDGNMYLYTKVQ